MGESRAAGAPGAATWRRCSNGSLPKPAHPPKCEHAPAAPDQSQTIPANPPPPPRGRAGSRKICNDRTQQQAPACASPDARRGADQTARGAGAPAAAAAKRKAAASSGSAGANATNGTTAACEASVLESAARFCQAASELQLLGVWRQSKRRKVAAVARAFAPMVVAGPLCGSGGAALEDEEEEAF